MEGQINLDYRNQTLKSNQTFRLLYAIDCDLNQNIKKKRMN